MCLLSDLRPATRAFGWPAHEMFGHSRITVCDDIEKVVKRDHGIVGAGFTTRDPRHGLIQQTLINEQHIDFIDRRFEVQQFRFHGFWSLQFSGQIEADGLSRM